MPYPSKARIGYLSDQLLHLQWDRLSGNRPRITRTSNSIDRPNRKTRKRTRVVGTPPPTGDCPLGPSARTKDVAESEQGSLHSLEIPCMTSSRTEWQTEGAVGKFARILTAHAQKELQPPSGGMRVWVRHTKLVYERVHVDDTPKMTLSLGRGQKIMHCPRRCRPDPPHSP